MKIDIQRVYDTTVRDPDAYRVLIDRLWPRGIRKAEFAHDAWEKELAPSAPLRKWFGHSPERWAAFCERYRIELARPDARDRMRRLIEAAGDRSITLLYGARDEQHNHARILAEELQNFRKVIRRQA